MCNCLQFTRLRPRAEEELISSLLLWYTYIPIPVCSRKITDPQLFSLHTGIEVSDLKSAMRDRVLWETRCEALRRTSKDDDDWCTGLATWFNWVKAVKSRSLVTKIISTSSVLFIRWAIPISVRVNYSGFLNFLNCVCGLCSSICCCCF